MYVLYGFWKEAADIRTGNQGGLSAYALIIYWDIREEYINIEWIMKLEDEEKVLVT